MDQEIKQAKEAFVSNLNGTSWQEIDSQLLMKPLCILLHSSMCVFLYQSNIGHRSQRADKTRPFNTPTMMENVRRYILDNILLVFPLLLSLTIWSDHLLAASQAMIVTIILLLVTSFSKLRRLHPLDMLNSVVKFDQKKDYISWYRAYVNILTAICILGVDFRIYPRRLAKTETYGTGLMDIFVGAFIMCNSLVCKEARLFKEDVRNWRQKLTTIRQVCTSCLPLLILGLLRLATTKASNYQEHVTEYGVHWNFFLTLAATRLLCTVIMCVIVPRRAALLSFTLAIVYQYLLSHRLKTFILKEGGRTGGWIAANREGVFSTLGYMCIYFAGVSVGRFIFRQPRMSLKSNLSCSLILLSASALSLTLQHGFEIYTGEITSRRMANLPFILWTLHHSLLLLGSMQVTCIVQHVIDAYASIDLSSSSTPILEAVNYNGLLYFLLANVCTGLVNLLVNTLTMDTLSSVAIMMAYLFVVNTVIYILYLKQIHVKFW